MKNHPSVVTRLTVTNGSFFPRNILGLDRSCLLLAPTEVTNPLWSRRSLGSFCASGPIVASKAFRSLITWKSFTTTSPLEAFFPRYSFIPWGTRRPRIPWRSYWTGLSRISSRSHRAIPSSFAFWTRKGGFCFHLWKERAKVDEKQAKYGNFFFRVEFSPDHFSFLQERVEMTLAMFRVFASFTFWMSKNCLNLKHSFN